MDNYKFELIRADEAQQITFSTSTKFRTCNEVDLVANFLDFASGCGFHKNLLCAAMQARIDEELLQ